MSRFIADRMPFYSNFTATIVLKFLNHVVVSSPQPEPIDDTAGVRAAPPGRGVPCAVQVRSRYGARDLMLPSHLTLSSDGATPRSSPRLYTKPYSSMGIEATAELRRTHADKHLIIRTYLLDSARSFVPLSLVVHLALRSALPQVLSSGSSSTISCMPKLHSAR